ncbi:hypothetical protein GCM10010346_28030 [Streptomyces chryseus]|uniref:Sigma-70 family RNA polymerase sigma factor n=1 Tax=Streptomyces chryseus TaxID=68186 RepID=A0ABQ3DMV1_9ACTN|nr:hypothetical protein GCM10010346_28030 [Streptomyces chryseus]
MGFLQGDPLAYGAKVVAEVERACGGLDAGEHARTIRGHELILSGVEPNSALRCIKSVRTREGTLEGGRIGIDDAAVIARVRGGEPEAYAELVRACTGIALRAAVAFGAGAEAEDVVRAAFFKAYRSLGRFGDGAAFRPWLLRIVANETRNTVRSAGRLRAATDREAALPGPGPAIPESTDPAVAALARERRRQLLTALDALNEDQRRVVTYRYLVAMDEAETAQALGWPRGTVKSRLNRGLRKLERVLPGLWEGGDDRRREDGAADAPGGAPEYRPEDRLGGRRGDLPGGPPRGGERAPGPARGRGGGPPGAAAEGLRALGRGMRVPDVDGATTAERVLAQLLAEGVPVPVAEPPGRGERVRARARRRWRLLTAALSGLLVVLVLTPPVRAAVAQ